MNKKGIVIDVGFAADIKDFISEIENQFKNIDFNSSIGLSEVFDEQVKDVRKKLTILKDEIDQTLNGKVSNDPNKQIQALNKAVTVLTSSFKEMVKIMPLSESSKLTAGLDSIMSDMNELSTVCDNATIAIKKVSDAVDGDIKFVNENQINELKNSLKIFGQLEKKAENVNKGLKKTGKISYKDEDEVLKDIIATFQKYKDIEDKLNIAKENPIVNQQSIKNLDELNQQYMQMSIRLQQLINTYQHFNGNLNTKIDFSGMKISINSIRSNVEIEFDELLDYISKRKAEIQAELYSLGVSDISDVIEDTNRITNKNKITVPIDISTKSPTLAKRALSIINEVQTKIDDNPLQLQVSLVSAYKTKRNSEILEQITASLDNIEDEEIKGKLSGLIDHINNQIGDELNIKVGIMGSEKISSTVKELIQDLQAQIDSADFTIYPDIEMTGEVKDKLQNDINALSEGVIVNIGIKDESGEDTGVGSTKKEIKTISKLRQNIEYVIAAINDKTAAFQIEEQTVDGTVRREISSLAELISWLNIVEDNIKDISTAIITLPDFKIEFDNESLTKIKDLKDNGLFNNLFTDIENDKNNFNKIVESLNEEAKVSLTLEDIEFNEKVKDIQASLASIPDTKEIKIVVKNPYDAPLNTDENGKIKTYYRGTSGIMSGFLSHNSRSGGTFYTDNYDVASTYSNNGKIARANLAMLNPLEIDAHGNTWSQIDNIGDAADLASKKIEKLKEKIKLLNDAGKDSSKFVKELNKLQALTSRYNFVTDDIVELAKLLDYDGVIFKNVIDTMAAGHGDPISTVSVIFDDEQVKNASIIEEKLISVKELLQKINMFDLAQPGKYTADQVYADEYFNYLDDYDFVNYLNDNFLSKLNDKLKSLSDNENLSKTRLEEIYKEIFRQIQDSYIQDRNIFDYETSEDLDKFNDLFANQISENIQQMLSNKGIDLGFQNVISDLDKTYDFEIKTNANEVYTKISELKEEILKLPDTKDIKINVIIGNNETDDIFNLELPEDKINEFQKLINYISNTGSMPGQFFTQLTKGSMSLNSELKEILKNLNLINGDNSVNFKAIKHGLANANTNSGVAISDDYTIIARTFSRDSKKIEDLIPKLQEAKKLGANVCTILQKIDDEDNDLFYEIQETGKGSDLGLSYSSNPTLEFLNATDEQILKLIQDIEILEKTGLAIDVFGDNILYDKEKGFSFIDLGTTGSQKRNPYAFKNNLTDIMEGYFSKIADIDEDAWVSFQDRVNNIAKNGINSNVTTYVSNQLSDIEINVKPKINAEEFAKDVTVQLQGVTANINVEPIVSKNNDLSNNYDEIYNDLIKARDFDKNTNLLDFKAFTESKDAINRIREKYDLNNKGIIIDANTDDEKLKEFAKQLSNIQTIAKDIFINIDSSDVNNSVTNIINELDRIPEQKDVLINIKKNDYSDINDLSDQTGKTMKFYRGVNGVYGGLISNSSYGGSFASSSLEVAQSYAEMGKVYEETVRFKNALEIDANGSDWASIVNLGNRADETSQKITELYQNMKYIVGNISKLINSFSISDKNKDNLIYSLNELIGSNLNEEFAFFEDTTGEKGSWIEEFEFFVKDLKQAGIESSNLDSLLTKLKKTAEEFKKISDDSSNIYGIHTTDEYLKYAIKNGNDGVIIRNVADDANQEFNQISDIVAPIFEDQVHNVKVVKESIDASIESLKEETIAFENEQKQVQSSVGLEQTELESLRQKIVDITKAVNKKTEAFREEGKAVGEVVGSEVNNLNPLQNLESSYNNFKSFYDNNDLESEAGAQAALSYYNAYKEALAAKVNKKDLQQYTIGKTDDLFTGNYTNYKNGIEELDLSGLDSQITKYQEIINKFNQPEVISIINSLTEAIEKLIATGNTSEQATALLKNLNTTINNLGGKNSTEKIAKVAENLENFQKSVQALDISDNDFIKSISAILEKGEELKSLGEVLKSTQKQINAAGKSVKDETGLKQAQEYLGKYEQDIREAVNKESSNKNETVLYQKLQATKDGLVQIIALIKDANDEYKQFIYTTTDGSKLNLTSTISGDDPDLARYIKQWESYQKEKANIIPGVSNWGKDGESFTPDSQNWNEVIAKAKEFGIELSDIVKILRNVDRAGNESFQIFTKLSRITLARNSNGILFQNDKVFNKDVIEATKKDIKSLQNELQNSFKGNDLYTEDFLKTLEKIGEEIKYISHLNKVDPKLITIEDLNDIKNYYNIFKTTLSSISLDKISPEKKTPEFLEQLNQAKTQLITLQGVLDKVDVGQVFSDDDVAQIKKFITQVRTLYDTMRDKENKLGNQGSISKVLGKIADVLSKNTAMSKDLQQRFRDLSAEIKSFGDNIPADKMTEFTNRFEDLKREMLESGKTGLSFWDSIINRAKSMSKSFISMYLSLYDIIRYVRSGITTIKDLDTALTEIRKVSDESTSSLKNFQNVSFDIAKTVGTTAKQIQESTADWMRLGETLNEASESAKVSNILLNVSEFESIDEATESLVAMSSAYSELDKMEIIDKLNEVGNNYAISTNGIATALQKSASSLKTASNDMDEAIALVTAGNAVVQDPDSVGAGLRTISLRLTGTKEASEELEEMGEDTEDVITTVSKLRDTIKSATAVASNGFKGFDIFDDSGNYKSTYEILKGISEIYQEIVETDEKTGSNNKNLLLETIAGKNRSNIAASILQNPDLLTSVYESAQNSAGSAEKELEKYLDSIEGKVAQFQNEVQEFWYNLIDSETVKWFIDAATKIVDVIGKITSALGEWGTLAAVGGTVFGIKALKNGGRAKKSVLKEIKMPPNRLAERCARYLLCVLV